jgi:hypothetical protein
MATTPTYSWPIPDDTDLVKDGAEAIRDLGNAIDTTVDGLPGAGLVHIETTDSGGAVSSLSLDNVFSSDFKNYKVIISDISASVTPNLTMRLRIAGSDDSTANYNYQSLAASASTVSATRTTNQTSINLGGIGAANTLVILDISDPFETNFTNIFSNHLFRPGTSSNQIRQLATGFALTTSFDGFSLIPASGTVTIGNVSVYGYK